MKSNQSWMIKVGVNKLGTLRNPTNELRNPTTGNELRNPTNEISPRFYSTQERLLTKQSPTQQTYVH